jgi:tetratricopeptide (TPR) repeat protein
LNNQTVDKDKSISTAIEAIKASRPLRAEEICRDYLDAHPGCADHIRMLGHALMKQNRLTEAEEQIRFALELRPGYPQLHEDLGSILGLQHRFEESITHLEKAIQLEPTLPLAHKKLGRALAAVGRGDEADQSFLEYFDRDPEKGEIAVAATHIKAGRHKDAIDMLKLMLRKNPENVDALCFLALAYRQGNQGLADAEALLRRATQIAPDHISAWLNLGSVMTEQNKRIAAIDCFKKATKIEPGHSSAWALLGNAYGQAGYPEKSVRAYERSLKLNPDVAYHQMGYAHVLKTVGNQQGSLAAYREAIRLRPQFGEVYWSMANLKIFNFEDQEVDAMLEQLGTDSLSESEDIHFRFALGKAFEDAKDYEKAWHYYHTGNQRQRTNISYDPVETEVKRTDIRDVFSNEFLRENENHGLESPDPIFILGMPRSGSTLIEQILASHSQVEGTAELPNLGMISSSIGRYRTDNVHFPHACRDLRNKDWRAYGQQYIAETQRYRETDKPFFTDKLPNNFPLVGLIHLMLPNAKIINTRRHPFDTLLGNYKQLFGHGQNFTYDMFDLADYYKQYLTTIDHWHEVLPGKVLDVHYEDTVLDLEGQVRRILTHCGLEFEESCVRFHENTRSVKTASSEQVRQPIYTSALGKWRRYETHLDLWQEEMSDIIKTLPESVRNAGL